MDVNRFYAFRWINGIVEPIEEPDIIELNELIGIEKQKRLSCMNIEAFLSPDEGLNMLLWGERGCGKSSLVKAILNKYKDRGLRVIELTKEGIENIYPLYSKVRTLPEYRFILFFDDLSFDNKDDSYRRFKSILEGGMEKTPENIIFVATSNRRLLTTNEIFTTNDLNAHEETNEQISLFGRFGLIIGFHPLSKNTYLEIVRHYLVKYGIKANEEITREAEIYATSRGGRSGRIARQFALLKKIESISQPNLSTP